jgi:hypothetical protein
LLIPGNPGGQAQLNISATDPLLAPVFPNILPTNNLTFRAGAIQFFQEDFQAPLIHQYDMIVEREIFDNTVVSASYIGSLGRNLPTFIDQNLARTGTFTTFSIVGGPNAGETFTLPQTNVANAAFAQLTRIESSVTSEYNALVLQANRRFNKGLQFQASYTFSRSTDTNQNSATFTQNNSPLDVFDRSYDNGPSNFDRRHKFVVSAVYAPNLYKGSSSFYNYLLNGWSIAPIYTTYSGAPYDGTVSGTVSGRNLNGTNGDNRFPLLRRNAFRLPSIHNFDLRLSKRFRLTERYNLEFLAEGFNVLNRTHVFGVESTLYTRSGNVLTFNPNFGQITGTDSTLYRERQIQFAARFQF